MSWWQELLGHLRIETMHFTFSDNEQEEANNSIEKYTKKWFEDECVPLTTDCESDSNGLNLCGHWLPEEMICLILSDVGVKDLLNCRLTCQKWRSMIDSQIWMLKLEKNIYKMLQKLKGDFEVPFSVYYHVYKNESFNRNFIKNSCGEDGLKYWLIVANGGDKWKVENPPVGSLPLEGSNSCFVTSFHTCTKEQLVDLRKEGLLPIIMDEIRPKIYVSEVFAGRFDCASTYKLDVTLMDRSYREIDQFIVEEKLFGDQWQKAEHIFEGYPPGVRFIKFRHSGYDNQFWKGHYGSKMSQACVKVMV